MDELLPCPFCGGRAAPNTVTYASDHVREQGWKQGTFHGINCVLCGTNNRGIVGFETEDEAAAHWNVRA